MNERILVVGMLDSVHLSKWLTQFKDQGIVFYLIPSSPHRRIHPGIHELVSGEHESKFLLSWVSRFGLVFWLLDKFLGKTLSGLLIANAVGSFRPNFIHLLETQNAGYSYLRAVSMFKDLVSVPTLLTLYGSDLFWFREFKAHQRRLKALLPRISVLSAECERDQLLATQLGFNGRFAPLMPAFGSVQFQALEVGSKRNLIVVKGYQNKWGQAAVALEALKRIKEHLVGFEIVVYSCDAVTLRIVSKLNKYEQMHIKAFPKHALSNFEVIQLMSRAACFIGLSTSDGLPASTIEAIGSGAIPIQSNTSCAGAWIESGSTGFIVDYWDVDAVAKHLEEICRSPSMSIRRASSQASTVQEAFTARHIFAKARETYGMLPKAATSL
jgi:glycosyltransferase involved in cell wall biosynthesis